MSQWTCKIGAEEIGPLSFQELAALAREGKVTETTRVRRRPDAPWEPAWTVIGLFADDGTARAPARTRSESPARASAGAELPGWSPPPKTRRATIEPLALLRLSLAAAFGAMWVGIAYRQAQWQALVFPAHGGQSADELACWFPVIGPCSALECACFYFDLFALTTYAAWRASARFFRREDSA